MENTEVVKTNDIQEIKDTLKEHGNILKEHGEKIDKTLGMVLTLQGQITIMQEQNNKRFDKIEVEHEKFKKEVNKRFDKQEADHEEFKINLGKLLEKEFTKRDKAISKQSKAIKKLQAKPTLLSCIKTGIRKFVSKTN